MSNPGGLSRAVRLALVGVVLTVQLVAVWAWVEPGPLSIDEVTYHRMTRALVGGDGLSLWNGYGEFPSVELTSQFMKPADGRLVAQYPYGYPVAAAPFYLAFGYLGLFVANAVAFVAVVVLSFRLGVRLVGDERVAAAACALLVVGTFLWEYSVAVWPHLSSLALLLFAFDAALSAHQGEPQARRSLLFALTAGLALGIGTTLRLDVLFAAPVLLAPLALRVRERWPEALAMLAGIVPGLIFLSATNLARWDNPSPLSYGRGDGLSELGRYVPALVAGIVAAAALWLASGPRVRSWLRQHRRALLGGLAALAALALVAAPVRETLLELARGAYVLLVDLRSLPLDDIGPAMDRSVHGAVLYAGGFKKALLQSMPYLPLVLVAGVTMWRDRAARARLMLLLGVPAVYAGFFSYSSWHGGLCLNMRYLIPALPFVAMLSARALFELGANDRRRAVLLGAVGGACGAVAYAAWRAAAGDSLATVEAMLMLGPLFIAAPLALACLLWSLRPARSTALVAIGLAGAGIAWSAAVAFEHDARWSHARRTFHHDVARAIAAQIEGDSLLLASWPDPFYGVIEHRERVRVATALKDDFDAAKPLIDHHHAAGRPVYAVLTDPWWRILHAKVGFAPSQVELIDQIGPYWLATIHPPDEQQARGGP